jgi:glycosyltransferase involved in cell wall biosynthesis
MPHTRRMKAGSRAISGGISLSVRSLLRSAAVSQKAATEHQSRRRIACFATQGTGHGEEYRILTLLGPFAPTRWPFERSNKRRSAVSLFRRGWRERPELVVIEGTGVAGGAAVIALDLLRRVPYVVSTGDAVAPFLAARSALLGPAAGIYERLLYRRAAGVIGWTPYIVGRAMTLGARRSMYAANWAPNTATRSEGTEFRESLGIATDDIVFGIVGSIDWNDRRGYCYGYELVQAACRLERDDVKVVVIGGGSGLTRLRDLAGDRLGRTVLLPGPVPRERVQACLQAFDVGSLPQSVDLVGALRYTTKLSEYLAASLPTVTGQLPLAYEFTGDWLWRLPGNAPWDEKYIAALAVVMSQVDRASVERRRALVPEIEAFDRDRQIGQVCAFVGDLLEDLTPSG